ncbi:MAG: hypothetical protein QM769_11220 [Pseudoxanthomonas sp.]
MFESAHPTCLLTKLRRLRQRPRGKWGLLTAALGLWPSLTGCIDPEAKYEDFLKREAASEADAGDTSGPTLDLDAGDVVLPEPEQLNGNYLYVVSADGYTQNPSIYELEVQAEKDGKMYTISIRDRPRKFKTYDSYVGDWGDWISPR